MKINFIPIISLIFLLAACSNTPTEKDLLPMIKEQEFLLSKPIFISLPNLPEINFKKVYLPTLKTDDSITLIIHIPLDSLNENNIEIKNKEISLSLPAAQLKKNEILSYKQVQDIINLNKNHIDQLKKEIQEYATSIFGEMFKLKGFRIIKIKFNSIK